MDGATEVETLADLVARSRQVVVLTGAGCSTESGIPDYRDEDGEWKHRRPVQFQDFVASRAMRQRYWARSMIGWKRVARARPNRAHVALAALEHAGQIDTLITQNIDGLHQQAGSHAVIDLHGRLAQVICLACSASQPRRALQDELEDLNPDWRDYEAADAPDGDARLEADFDGFRVPDCGQCGGVLKPDVVFFGESVPRPRVERAMRAVGEANLLLVAGSSLMVWSGLRFVRAAAGRGIDIALVNLGRTRADELFTHRVRGACGDTLTALAARLRTQPTIR